MQTVKVNTNFMLSNNSEYAAVLQLQSNLCGFGYRWWIYSAQRLKGFKSLLKMMKMLSS